MTKARLIYLNRWRNGTLATPSSEHPQFPADYTQDDVLILPWRSRHGTGSGAGLFVVTASNNKIDGNHGAEILTDGGLETWSSATALTNWTGTVGGSTTINREATSPHGGTYCLRFDTDAPGTISNVAQNETLTAGALYKLSLWYKTTAGKTARVMLKNSGNNVYLTSAGAWQAGATQIVLPATTVWTRYTLTFTSHASYTAYVLQLQNGAWASSQMWFDDVSLVPAYAATLTPASYNGQTLATEIVTQINAASGGTYTCTYSEATGKFTIARAAGNFGLSWLTGTNVAANAGNLLGFGRTADSSGAATYTSATAVFHTIEYLDIDFGSAMVYDFVGLQTHNLTAAAVVTVTGADDVAFTTNPVTDTLTWAANNIYTFLGTARTKRYVRVGIVDVANPSGYVQVSSVILGKYFEPNRTFGPYAEGEVDETEVEFSPSANLFVTQERPKLVARDLEFKGLTAASVSEVRQLLAECGKSKGFILCTDTTAPNTNSFWVRLRETNQPQCQQLGYWTWAAPLEEML